MNRPFAKRPPTPALPLEGGGSDNARAANMSPSPLKGEGRGGGEIHA